MKILTYSVIVTSALLSLGAARAETVFTDEAGMTLYTYDKDTDGVSVCYDDCAVTWVPYMVKEGVKKDEGWTMSTRRDGGDQWVFKGHPVYLYTGDKAPGEQTGMEKDSSWHKIGEESAPPQ